MKKIFLLLFLVALLPLAVAEEEKSLYLLGKGIAVGEPTDISIVKVGVGKIKGKTVGVLKVDDEKYRVKNIERDEETVSGTLYQDDTEVGSFKVTSVVKEHASIWSGTLTLDGTEKSLYVLDAPRKIKKSELRDRVRNYCKDNEDANCRERIADFCENNADDKRCKALHRAYCVKHTDDVRCREAFKEWCKENKDDEKCHNYVASRTKKYCAENKDSKYCQVVAKRVAAFCEKNPDKCEDGRPKLGAKKVIGKKVAEKRVAHRDAINTDAVETGTTEEADSNATEDVE